MMISIHVTTSPIENSQFPKIMVSKDMNCALIAKGYTSNDHLCGLLIEGFKSDACTFIKYSESVLLNDFRDVPWAKISIENDNTSNGSHTLTKFVGGLKITTRKHDQGTVPYLAISKDKSTVILVTEKTKNNENIVGYSLAIGGQLEKTADQFLQFSDHWPSKDFEVLNVPLILEMR